jgi:uncharacterized protein YaeQ
MASKATVIKAELQVSDMHRLMVRLLALALHADERLESGAA